MTRAAWTLRGWAHKHTSTQAHKYKHKSQHNVQVKRTINLWVTIVQVQTKTFAGGARRLGMAPKSANAHEAQVSPPTQVQHPNHPFISNFAKSLFDICYMHSMVLTFLELFLLLREDLPVETSAPTQVTFSFRSLPTSSSSPSLDSPGSRRITPWKWRFSLKIQWFHIFVRSLVENKCVAGNK